MSVLARNSRPRLQSCHFCPQPWSAEPVRNYGQWWMKTKKRKEQQKRNGRDGGAELTWGASAPATKNGGSDGRADAGRISALISGADMGSSQQRGGSGGRGGSRGRSSGSSRGSQPARGDGLRDNSGRANAALMEAMLRGDGGGGASSRAKTPSSQRMGSTPSKSTQAAGWGSKPSKATQALGRGGMPSKSSQAFGWAGKPTLSGPTARRQVDTFDRPMARSFRGRPIEPPPPPRANTSQFGNHMWTPSWSARRGFSTSTRLADRPEDVSIADSEGSVIGEIGNAKRSDNTEKGAVTGLKALGLKMMPRGGAQDAEAKVVFGQRITGPIRARFAPSPTGHMHLGSLRTALFNKLATSAVKGGSFILRIEDTDQNRLVPGTEEQLMRDLRWAGLEWNEGPDIGGPHGPYRQSERLDTYNRHIQTLLNEDKAYRCFCSTAQLNKERLRLHEAGKSTLYPGTCRSISSAESEQRAKKGEEHVVRFKADKELFLKHVDGIYGPFQKNEPEDDFVLMKTDGFPTYHFANVVDDHLMEITLVIRGDEWLISTPKHIALYNAFGWTPPAFAHLGLLVTLNGLKLSKRDKSLALSEYRADDTPPIALLNWLANLGSSFRVGAEAPTNWDQIVEVFTFRGTRGSIRMDRAKLAHYREKSLNSIFRDPDMQHLADEYIITPLLKEIDDIDLHRKDDKKHFDGLTPALRRDLPIEQRKEYLSRALSARKAALPSKTELTTDHRYLFWRPSLDAYCDTLKHLISANGRLDDKSPISSSIIELIQKMLSPDWRPLWQPGPDGVVNGEAVMQDLRRVDTIAVEMKKSLHSALRIIIAGDYRAPSMASGVMLSVLGREELAARFEVFTRVLEDIGKQVKEVDEKAEVGL